MLKVYILHMVGSEQLNNEWNTTPKIPLGTRQAAAATPTTSATKENNEGLLETKGKL